MKLRSFISTIKLHKCWRYRKDKEIMYDKLPYTQLKCGGKEHADITYINLSYMGKNGLFKVKWSFKVFKIQKWHYFHQHSLNFL